MIERQVDQLAHLVDDLLDVTRISRNLDPAPAPHLDLDELVRRTAEDHRSLFQERGVRLEVETAPDPVHVDGDPTRLAQVVGNLLQNAAKFTGQGGCARRRGRGRARCAGRALPPRRRTTALGMTREMLSRLFQPFIQADETLDRTRGGLGLGLALVKGLVELHGGTHPAPTAPARGRARSSRCTLPLAAAIPAAPAGAPPGAPPLGSGGASWSSRTTPTRPRPCGRCSSSRATRWSAVADSGPDGLAAGAHVRPRGRPLRHRPARHGRLRGGAGASGRTGSSRSTHLVALTGYAQPEDLRRAAEAGFDDHMAKPPDLDELERVLARFPPP